MASALFFGLLSKRPANKKLRQLIASAEVVEDPTAAKKSSFLVGPVKLVQKTFRNRGIQPPPETLLQIALFAGPVVSLPFFFLGSFSQLLLGIVLVVAGPAALYVWLNRSAKERQKAFGSSLPEFLLTVSSAMQSGLSLEQAMRDLSRGRKTVAEEVFYEISRGVGYGESLDRLLKRYANLYKSDDTETLRQATAIGKRTGSSLTHVIESVANSAIERAKVRREIAALTAEGMMSAYVIIALPFLASAFLLLTNPEYLSVFWETRNGMVLAGFAILMIVVGWVWMRNMIRGESTKL